MLLHQLRHHRTLLHQLRHYRTLLRRDQASLLLLLDLEAFRPRRAYRLLRNRAWTLQSLRSQVHLQGPLLYDLCQVLLLVHRLHDHPPKLLLVLQVDHFRRRTDCLVLHRVLRHEHRRVHHRYLRRNRHHQSSLPLILRHQRFPTMRSRSASRVDVSISSCWKPAASRRKEARRRSSLLTRTSSCRSAHTR